MWIQAILSLLHVLGKQLPFCFRFAAAVSIYGHNARKTISRKQIDSIRCNYLKRKVNKGNRKKCRENKEEVSQKKWAAEEVVCRRKELRNKLDAKEVSAKEMSYIRSICERSRSESTKVRIRVEMMIRINITVNESRCEEWSDIGNKNWNESENW